MGRSHFLSESQAGRAEGCPQPGSAARGRSVERPFLGRCRGHLPGLWASRERADRVHIGSDFSASSHKVLKGRRLSLGHERLCLEVCEEPSGSLPESRSAHAFTGGPLDCLSWVPRLRQAPARGSCFLLLRNGAELPERGPCVLQGCSPAPASALARRVTRDVSRPGKQWLGQAARDADKSNSPPSYRVS